MFYNFVKCCEVCVKVCSVLQRFVNKYFVCVKLLEKCCRVMYSLFVEQVFLRQLLIERFVEFCQVCRVFFQQCC